MCMHDMGLQISPKISIEAIRKFTIRCLITDINKSTPTNAIETESKCRRIK